MIPPFNDNGYLPPGVHAARLEEVEARFGLASECARVQMELFAGCGGRPPRGSFVWSSTAARHGTSTNE